MKISYNWLSEYIDHGRSAEELAELLTSAGLEVEEIEHFSLAPKHLEGLVVGQVKSVVQHPNADRLRLTKVDIGAENLLTIVCGAPNVAEGQKVIVATVGALLHPSGGEPFTIKRSKIRGEDSEGMICAEDEIGLGKNHDGIMILKEDAKVGQSFKEYLNAYEDQVFEVSLTPNRVDAASHIGTARDVAALLGKKVKYPAIPVIAQGATAPEIKIVIENSEGCPRYSGIIIKNISVQESPAWLQNALKSIGLQPINNIVDVTNFVLHEFGQPLHAFDLSKIKGNRIIVRDADKSSEFITLDKQIRKLDGSELMICNEEGPMAIAGIFGGMESGISTSTKDIFIESAYFNPSRIRRTSRRHQIFTDASFRFERGADPGITLKAMLRAAALIVEVAGGEIIEHIYDEYPKPILPVSLQFRYDYLNRIAGSEIFAEKVRDILVSLEIKIINESMEDLELEIPTFKTDITRPIDVVEEVLRIYSFDKIPVSKQVKSILQVDNVQKKEKLKKKLSAFLTGQGFSEAYHLSFVSSKEIENQEKAVRVLNPISLDLESIRDNMMKPGLKSLLHNMNRQQPDVKLFEWGHSYQRQDDNYSQQSCLSLWATGNQKPESWYPKDKKQVDFYFMKGIAEALLTQAGAMQIDYREHISDSFELAVKTDHLLIAKLSTAILAEAELSKPVFYIELDLESLLLKTSNYSPVYNSISRFPKVERDLSLIVPKELKYDDIKKKINKAGSSILKTIRVFDVYQGEQVPKGFKSYNIRLEFEDKNETLEDKKVDKVIKHILEGLEQNLGVKIRD